MSEEQILKKVEKCLRQFVQNGGSLTSDLKEELRVRLLVLIREANERKQ